MADHATLEYNLTQAQAQLDRCEQMWQQLQAMATANLTEMAHLRSMLAALAQAVGVDVAPAAAAPPAAPAPSAPPSQEASPEVPPARSERAGASPDEAPASPSGSRGRSSSPRSGEKD